MKKAGEALGKAAQDAAKNPAAAMGMLKAIMDGSKSKINNSSANFMVGFALFIDIIQLILTFFAIGLVIAPILTGTAMFIFWLWFSLKGVSFFGKRQMVTEIISFIIEYIPALGALPILTIMIILVIGFIRLEETSKGESKEGGSGEEDKASNVKQFKKAPARIAQGGAGGVGEGSVDENIKNKKRSGVELKQAA
ncbi:MAG TPA: hypothetical protein VJJ22_04870 [Candidatus Paceibacterota bacterium]